MMDALDDRWDLQRVPGQLGVIFIQQGQSEYLIFVIGQCVTIPAPR